MMPSVLRLLAWGWLLLPICRALEDCAACVFPFIYRGRSYPTCTRDGSWPRRTLWCATTASYDQDSRWKRCFETEYGGNSDGQPCTFPFVYRRRAFYTCTDEGDKPRRFWCATTGSYDRDRLWSYCPDTLLAGNSTALCTFPFTYQNRTYLGCTADGDASGRRWCSLTRNYDVDHKRTYCLDSDDPGFWTPNSRRLNEAGLTESACEAGDLGFVLSSSTRPFWMSWGVSLPLAVPQFHLRSPRCQFGRFGF